MTRARIGLLCLCILAFGSERARAEDRTGYDFTGVYAGLNAGYGFGRGSERPGGPAFGSGGDGPGVERGLPPSAASASQTMGDARARSYHPSR